MKIEYTKVGDYYLPNLVAPENMKNFEIGKYGKLRLRYLKEHKKAEYTILLMDNKLQKHLIEVDKIATERFELLMKQYGIKLAEELWGDRFQVIVSTHLNTDNIHTHFVLNSVSFLDGKRFCNTKKDYVTMRKTSDRLCEDYGLSVLKQEEKYNKYATSGLYKELMKDSIDYAIENAKDYNEFIKILQDLDYVVTDKNNTLSIRREPYKRNTRIERQFGNKYSKENIYKRILETQPLFPYTPNPQSLLNRTFQKYNNIKQTYFQNKSSIIGLIFHYEKLFGINAESVSKPNITRMTPELLKEINQMDEYSNQAKFLAKYKINTEQELLDFKKSTYDKINP